VKKEKKKERKIPVGGKWECVGCSVYMLWWNAMFVSPQAFIVWLNGGFVIAFPMN
jgi:hypothetical protein